MIYKHLGRLNNIKASPTILEWISTVHQFHFFKIADFPKNLFSGHGFRKSGDSEIGRAVAVSHTLMNFLRLKPQER